MKPLLNRHTKRTLCVAAKYELFIDVSTGLEDSLGSPLNIFCCFLTCIILDVVTCHIILLPTAHKAVSHLSEHHTHER